MQRPAYSSVLTSGRTCWKQPGLYLFCYFQFLCGATFGLHFFGKCTALCFNRACQFVEARKPKRVSIPIFKACEYTAPGRLLWWRLKANSSAAPFFVFSPDILGDKVNLAIASDELVCVGTGFRQSKRDIRAAVRGADFDPPSTIFEGMVH
jgi:hypothetical protein